MEGGNHPEWCAMYRRAVGLRCNPKLPSTASPNVSAITAAEERQRQFVLLHIEEVAQELAREGKLPHGATHVRVERVFKVGVFDGCIALLKVRGAWGRVRWV
jgi:hypothetical protein